MKPLKISEANAVAISDWLQSVNGKSTAHTYTLRLQIKHLAEAAEASLEALQLTKAERPGALFCSTSGDSVPSAYKYSRDATEVTIERRSGDWFLVDVRAVQIYNKPPKARLILTPEQDSAAVRKFRDCYTVAPSSEPPSIAESHG